MELATVFIERKDVLFFLQQTSQKTKKKMVDFTEPNMEEPDNFKTSGLSDHYKSKKKVQVINEGKYIKST